jgi:hypothetical protein
MRAMVTHSGQELNGLLNMYGSLESIDYPGNEQGYGRVELDQILLTSEDSSNLLLMGAYSQDDNPNEYVSFSSEDEVHTYTLKPSSSDSTLRVTLAWTDPVPYSGASNLLVNDLDLSITTPEGETLYPSSTGGASKDDLNTLEMIDISSPTAGGEYTISISASQLSDLSYGDQTYGMVVTGQFCLSSVSGLTSTPSFMGTHSCSLSQDEIFSITLSAASHPSTIAGFFASSTLIIGLVLYLRAKGYSKH